MEKSGAKIYGEQDGWIKLELRGTGRRMDERG
jgi:hypothetical protein